jgi:hypothetical protein
MEGEPLGSRRRILTGLKAIKIAFAISSILFSELKMLRAAGAGFHPGIVQARPEIGLRGTDNRMEKGADCSSKEPFRSAPKNGYRKT